MILLQKNYSFQLFAMLFLLSSCEKEDVEPKCKNQCTTLRGRLVTHGGNSPIAKTVVKVDWARPSMFGSGGYRVKAKTKTDDNGYYELSFYVSDEELEPNSSGYFGIKYEINGDTYLDSDNQVGSVVGYIPFEPKRDTTYTLADFLIPKKAYVKVHCPNQSQINIQNGDKFEIWISTALGIKNQNGVFNLNYATFFNFANTNGNTFEFAGEQNVYATFVKTKNGVKTEETETIVIPEGTTYEIIKEF